MGDSMSMRGRFTKRGPPGGSNIVGWRQHFSLLRFHLFLRSRAITSSTMAEYYRAHLGVAADIFSRIICACCI